MIFLRSATWPVIVASAVLAVTVAASAQDDTLATARLSPETRSLIIREMQALDAAMGTIHTALITGDHATVAREAHRIHDSFVLAQGLSPAQRSEIGNLLPPDFLVQDQQFHQLAARLAAAARDHDPQLERLWYQEMTRACQSCHAAHATARFPGLRASDRSDQDHSH
jgi:hypothetical protein